VNINSKKFKITNQNQKLMKR